MAKKKVQKAARKLLRTKKENNVQEPSSKSQASKLSETTSEEMTNEGA